MEYTIVIFQLTKNLTIVIPPQDSPTKSAADSPSYDIYSTILKYSELYKFAELK